MNEKQMKKRWNEIRGDIQKNWTKLTNDDLEQVYGDMDLLAEKISERYGREHTDAKGEVNRYLENFQPRQG